MSLATGTKLGRYEIRAKIGEGGMGEVYLAEDTRLNRKVALKRLPEDSTADESAKRRFIQEAKTASALNHPHIITIYDISSEDHHEFIAMEYVEGETLRTLLTRGKIEITRAVEFAAQVASGLAAAHAAGIVHRDIKPDNLIVARASQLKILDFGLAKLVEKQRTAMAGDLSTLAFPESSIHAGTKPGVIMGTVAYMSPEQATGRALDHRTDIFSLGVVLYEMLTGKRPFDGKSPIETLHTIINQEPPPAVELNPRLPAEVSEILAKALAKDGDERYQHAGDFELDLRRFKRALETNSLASTQAQRVVIPDQQRKNRMAVLLGFGALGALVLLGGGLLGWVLSHGSAPPKRGIKLESFTLTPLTTEPGYEGEPTFSPDGETLAYVSDRTGNFEIFLKQVSGGPDVQLTTSPADDVQPSFSPDGKQIAFVSTRSSQTGLFYPVTDSPMVGGDVWVMSALGDKGGNARRIAEQGNFPSWSPDGKEILYMSQARGQKAKIYKIPSTGGEAREVALKFRADESLAYAFYPRSSSDGRWIAFQGNNDNIYVMSAEGGEPQPIGRGKAPAWSADSSALIYSNKERGKNLSLWQIPFSLAEGKPAGPPEPLTVSRGWDLHAAISRNGKMIAFTAEEDSFNIEAVAFDAETGRVGGVPKPLTTGQNTNFFGNFAPDARSVVFESARGSSTHIWRADPGSPPVQLTSDPEFDDTYPRWSPDSRSISFVRTPVVGPPSAQSLWLMTADGANPQKLADGFRWHAWTPDSRAIIGWSWVTRQHVLLNLATKQQRSITNEEGVLPVVTISSDGKWMAYQSKVSGNVDVRIAPVEGGESRVAVATPRSDFHPFFSPSGKWLYFQPDHKNIYRVPGPAQDWRKAEPEKVTNFPESGLFLEDPQISRDGHWLLHSRGRITGDIWILKQGPD